MAPNGTGIDKPIIHSIHCAGYLGCKVGFDDNHCDCGATIKALTARLAAAEKLLNADESELVQLLIVNEKHIEEVEQRLAEAEKENETLWLFIADQPCDCYDEYGEMLPKKCDRCKLIEAANGGRDE